MRTGPLPLPPPPCETCVCLTPHLHRFHARPCVRSMSVPILPVPTALSCMRYAQAGSPSVLECRVCAHMPLTIHVLVRGAKDVARPPERLLPGLAPCVELLDVVEELAELLVRQACPAHVWDMTTA